MMRTVNSRAALLRESTRRAAPMGEMPGIALVAAGAAEVTAPYPR